MATRNNDSYGGNGSATSGTVEGFKLPDIGTSGDDNGVDIPVESSEPDTGESTDTGNTSGVKLNKRGKPDGRFKRNRTDTSTKETSNRAGLPNLDITAGALKGAHDLTSMIVRMLGDPKFDELELDDDEAVKLAKSLLALAKYYPSIDVPGIYIAWMSMLTTMGAVYSPKVMAYRLRKSNEADEKKKQKPALAIVQ